MFRFALLASALLLAPGCTLPTGGWFEDDSLVFSTDPVVLPVKKKTPLTKFSDADTQTPLPPKHDDHRKGSSTLWVSSLASEEQQPPKIGASLPVGSEFDGTKLLSGSTLKSPSNDGSPWFDSWMPAGGDSESGWAILLTDQRQFYSRKKFRPFLLTLGTAAILANTRMDQEFSDWYQDDVRSNSTDDVAEFAKSFGEQWPMMGAYAGAAIGGRLFCEDPRLAAWGDRSIRSMFVGVPPLLLMQKLLGSSRPNDVPPSSNWDFWADDNGASGHTFVGAVPFLVAAQLAERPGVKATWFALSTLPGWSRINDNDHYLSQVLVGWWIAYAATRSIERSDEESGFEISPIRIGNSTGLGITWSR